MRRGASTAPECGTSLNAFVASSGCSWSHVIRHGSDLPGEEIAVGIRPIPDKRLACFEARFPVKAASRREIWHRSGFEAQAAVPPPPGFCDDVLQKRTSNSLSQMPLRCSHGLGLAMPRIDFLESATPGQLPAIPHSPERDTRLAKLLQIQRMTTLGR